MRIKSRVSTRREGRVASKIPRIEFDKKAIREIKKRKKGIYDRFLRKPRKKGR